MVSVGELPLDGVGVVTNLEAKLRVQGPRVVEQLDGEVRYSVERGREAFVVQVRAVVLRVEWGVVSARIEADRVFVSVAQGEVSVSEGGLTDVLIAGDLLRLPRLRIAPDRVQPPPLRSAPMRVEPPPPPLRAIGRRTVPPPPPSRHRPTIELPRADSGALTLRRPAPTR